MSDGKLLTLETRDKALIATVQVHALDEVATTGVQDALLRAAGSIPAIVLDLTKVDFAPSIALGALVKLTKTLKLDGHRLILVGVQQRVRGAIAVTRLDKLLEIHPTVADALKGL